MNNSTKGKMLINSYTQSGKFETSMRADLVHLIIDEVMTVHPKLTSKMADNISDEIVKLFPTESKNVYYFPARPSKKNSGGKLIDRYRNVLNKYRSPNSSKAKKDKPGPISNIISDDIASKIAWLKCSTEPFKIVEEYWDDCSEVRFRDRLKAGPVSEFVEKWPSLKDKHGFFFVNSD